MSYDGAIKYDSRLDDIVLDLDKTEDIIDLVKIERYNTWSC